MEDENLISKKEILEKYGISYGALYRWKRKGLIPDEWFIKRSAVTGQETFFPKKMVCERIETILAKKEDVLLDELAKEISGKEKQEEFVVLVTEFGEKTFRMNDIKSIYAQNKDGKRIELLNLIQNAVESLNKD